MQVSDSIREDFGATILGFPSEFLFIIEKPVYMYFLTSKNPDSIFLGN